jgi:FtsZ-interacting cell division protein ZipA
VVFHVTAPADGSFSGTKIRAVAEASGLVLDQDGRFALCNDAGQVLFALCARDGRGFAAATIKDAAPAGLSLSLEVPRVPDLRRSFHAMAGFARQLAAVLGGSLVDDNGHLLDERAVAAIGAQLDAVRGEFDARGIATGSAEALRLFS